MSQDAARHLYAVQGGSNSEGLLVVCGVTVEGRTGVALMKLEEEEGVQVEQSTVSGKPTLSFTVLDNLMLTDNTRVLRLESSGCRATDWSASLQTNSREHR